MSSSTLTSPMGPESFSSRRNGPPNVIKKLWNQGKKTGSSNAYENSKKALKRKKTKELMFILEKQQDEEISRLKILLMEKSTEVEKLKELCLKRREEIKSIKSAITSFP